MASTKAVTRGDFDRLCGDVKERQLAKRDDFPHG